MTWQEFSAPSDPAASAPRLAALRALMARDGLDAVLVPRADAHQGEYVADADARLRWLTGLRDKMMVAAIMTPSAATMTSQPAVESMRNFSPKTI